MKKDQEVIDKVPDLPKPSKAVLETTAFDVALLSYKEAKEANRDAHDIACQRESTLALCQSNLVKLVEQKRRELFALSEPKEKSGEDRSNIVFHPLGSPSDEGEVLPVIFVLSCFGEDMLTLITTLGGRHLWERGSGYYQLQTFGGEWCRFKYLDGKVIEWKEEDDAAFDKMVGVKEEKSLVAHFPWKRVSTADVCS